MRPVGPADWGAAKYLLVASGMFFSEYFLPPLYLLEGYLNPFVGLHDTHLRFDKLKSKLILPNEETNIQARHIR